jgi:redox-sensitive bicupin YhaK (pirin superfamily)
MLTLRRSDARGRANLGWLESRHTFSFGEYHDPAHMGYRSLRVINDDRVAPSMGFGTHPHRDMEILSYVLSGSLEHKDDLGNGRVLRAGDLQYMAAGTGVRHSEFNPSTTEPVHFLQIWIVPDRRGAPPAYADRAVGDMQGLGLLASGDGRAGSMRINQDADIWLARLATGAGVTHSLAAGRGAWVHVATGKISVNGTALEAGDAVSVEGPAAIALGGVEDSQVLLFDLA